MNDIDKISQRLNELESQLCGAKKKRIDGLEERLQEAEKDIDDLITCNKLNGAKITELMHNGLEERLKWVGDDVNMLHNDITVLSERVKAIETRLAFVCPICHKEKCICKPWTLSDSLDNIIKATEPKDSKREESTNCPRCGELPTNCDCPLFGPKREPWKPKNGEKYYYLNATLSFVREGKENNDKILGEDNNVFRTRKQAESFLQRIKELRKEF